MLSGGQKQRIAIARAILKVVFFRRKLIALNQCQIWGCPKNINVMSRNVVHLLFNPWYKQYMLFICLQTNLHLRRLNCRKHKNVHLHPLLHLILPADIYYKFNLSNWSVWTVQIYHFFNPSRIHFFSESQDTYFRWSYKVGICSSLQIL